MAGNKLTLELDSSPNKLIKATLLAWMDLPVAWADWDRYIADNPVEDAPAQLTLDDALKVSADPAEAGEILGARCGGCHALLRFNGEDYDDCTNIACPYNAEDEDGDLPADFELTEEYDPPLDDDDGDPDEC